VTSVRSGPYGYVKSSLAVSAGEFLTDDLDLNRSLEGIG
jgi:hypothetical protein